MYKLFFYLHNCTHTRGFYVSVVKLVLELARMQVFYFAKEPSWFQEEFSVFLGQC